MIVSRQNRWIKDIRHLRRSKADRALLEGPHLLQEAITADIPLEIVLATPEYAASFEAKPLLESVADQLQLVRSDILESVTDSDSPRGVVAIGDLPRAGVAALPQSPDGIYLYCDGVQEPGNLGALARVSEACGVTGLALASGCAHPNHPRALRASAGSLLRIPVAREVTVTDLERHLGAIEADWWALAPGDGDDIFETDVPQHAVILLVGAEGQGLGTAAAGRADRRINLPMKAPVESLNVAVAAGVALYEIHRRRS